MRLYLLLIFGIGIPAISANGDCNAIGEFANLATKQRALNKMADKKKSAEAILKLAKNPKSHLTLHETNKARATLVEIFTAEELMKQYPEQSVAYSKKIRTDRFTRDASGRAIPLSYEIDVDMKCCLIEVSTTKIVLPDRLSKGNPGKVRQLDRFVNSTNPDNRFVNPQNKPVILFVPNMVPGQVSALEEHFPGLLVATNLDDLHRIIGALLP